MSDIEFKNELVVAINAAKKAGKFLIEQKKTINKVPTSDTTNKLTSATFSRAL